VGEMQKSSYVIAITIGFSTGVLLSYFGRTNVIATILLSFACLILIVLFWKLQLIRLTALALLFLFIGYLYPLFLGRDSLIVLYSQNPILVFFQQMGDIFINALQKVLPQPEASLAAGLVVGTKNGFPPELKKEFINTGTIHLVAVSGFNVTIVLKIFSDWLRPFGRWVAFITGTLGLVGFIILTGGQASVVRAGIMGWLFLLAMFSFRQFHIRNALFIAGMIMIIFQPKIIKDGIGFQLSFGAMLGLIYISPLVKTFLEKTRFLNKIPNFLSAALEETLGAQIAVAFLILGHFGRLSLIAPIPNILIVPMIFLPMLITIIIGILSLIIHSWAILFTIPLVYMLRYILSVINFFNFKYASFQFNQWNWPIIFLAYIVLILIVYIINKRLKKSSPLSFLKLEDEIVESRS
jgi:competence protein ComEC